MSSDHHLRPGGHGEDEDGEGDLLLQDGTLQHLLHRRPPRQGPAPRQPQARPHPKGLQTVIGRVLGAPPSGAAKRRNTDYLSHLRSKSKMLQTRALISNNYYVEAGH